MISRAAELLSLKETAVVANVPEALVRREIERKIVKRSEILACRGSNSVTRKPGVRVGSVSNGPRYSAGASGFGSYVSRWLPPPRSHTMMTAVRSRAVAAAAWRR